MRIHARATLAAASLTAALVGSGIAFAGTAQAASGDACTITASAANLRSAPSTSSDILGVGYQGQGCTEENMTYTGGHFWYQVQMSDSGVVGWVRDDLVSVDGGGRTCIPEDVTCS